jgi:hypothetical protein
MTAFKFHLMRAGNALRKAKILKRARGRRALFKRYPVRVLTIFIVLPGLFATWLMYWIIDHYLTMLGVIGLGLRSIFTASHAALGEDGVFWAALLLGFALFFVRQRLAVLYAFIELSFGGVVAGVAALRLYIQTAPVSSNDAFALYTVLIGALYVLVRGWDNLTKSIVVDINRLQPRAFRRCLLSKS